MKYNINGKYPVMANWVETKKIEHDTYYVRNGVTDIIYELDSMAYGFLRNLNGDTNPLELGEKYDIDTDEILKIFIENLLVRTEGKKVPSKKGIYMRTIYIPQKKRNRSMFLALYNLVLMLCWCPILYLGIYWIQTEGIKWNSDFALAGGIIGMMLGILLHEFSHAAACLHYKGGFYEFGVVCQYVYPGAYVIVDKSTIKSRLKRVQVDAAGVESNFVLAGLCWILNGYYESISGCLFMAGLINILLGIINLSFIDGFDGHSVMLEILGFDGKQELKRIVKNALKKSAGKELSMNQKVIIVTVVILMIYQVLLPIMAINSFLIFLDGVLM